MTTAPPMANSINIDGGGKRDNMANAKPQGTVAPAMAPTIAVRDARKAIGKTRARHPSTAPVIADAGKVRKDSAIATNGAKPGGFALGPASIKTVKTVKNIDTGASSMNTSALFIEVRPSAIVS
jgi:hypothetical protein